MPASLSFFQGDHPPHIGATVLDWISWPFWFSATNHRHHKKTPLLISITSFVKIISLYPDPRAGGLAGSLASVVLGSWPGPRFCFSFFPKTWIQIVLQTWSCHLLNIIPCRLDSRASLL